MRNDADIRRVDCGRPGMRCLLAAAAVCLLLVMSGGKAGAQTRQNKELLDSACHSAGISLITKSGLTASSSVMIKFSGGERTEFFRSPFIDAAAQTCRVVTTSGASVDTIATFSVEQARVSYGPAFRDGWFGERRTQRTISLDVRLELVSASRGTILFTNTIGESVADTIAVDEIAEAAASTRHIAWGEPPGPSMWERILEPAILTVSSGIAVYLFFTVRS
ncbi:MAG TPA: hypothetical protein VK470_07930 [Bacteroidota bacterium]|nr:hypothetical protein [Bacteroidota bacterium]